MDMNKIVIAVGQNVYPLSASWCGNCPARVNGVIDVSGVGVAEILDKHGVRSVYDKITTKNL